MGNQISGELAFVKDALVQVLIRLKANLFEREGAVSGFLPVPTDGPDDFSYDARESRRHGRGYSYSSGYGGSSDLPAGDGYGGPQVFWP